MIHPSTDLNSQIINKLASIAQDASGDPKIVTAGATEDGVKVTGYTLDRKSTLTYADSASLSINYIAKLTAAKTIAFAAEYQTSADGSTWDTAVALQASTVAATGAGTKYGVVELALNMRGLKRYVRFNITPDLSNTGTDTCIWSANAAFSGYGQGPQ